jgi:soluble lytic murein transglycosylase-like protein
MKKLCGVAICLSMLTISVDATEYQKVFLPKEYVIDLSLKTAAKANVSPYALYAISRLESGHNMYAYNPANKNGTADMGLMQINSAWLPLLKKNGLSDTRRIYNPEYNFQVGAWILRQCIDRFGQSWKSIDCYNKGPGGAKNSGAYINRFIASYNRVPFYEFEQRKGLVDKNATRDAQASLSFPYAYAAR